MILSTHSFDDIDFFILNTSPEVDPIVAPPGSFAMVLTSGEFYINENGTWQRYVSRLAARIENLPHYFKFINSEQTILAESIEPKNYKIDIVGDGEVLVLDNNNIVTQTISKTGFIFESNSLKVKGRAISNGKIDNLQYIRQSSSLAASPWLESNPREIWISNDGIHVYVVGTSRDRVMHGILSTPFDISTLTKQFDELVVASYDGNASSLFLSPDRNHLYFCGTSNRNIIHFTLTNGDLSTAVYQSKFSIVGIEGTPHSVVLNDLGTFIYFIGATNDRIFQYPLNTPWQLSTIGTQLGQMIVVTQESSPTGISFNQDGSKCYITGTTSDKIHEYILNTPWMITTGTYTGRNFYIGSKETSPHGLKFVTPDHMYVVGTSQDRIFEYQFVNPEPDFEMIFQEIL